MVDNSLQGSSELIILSHQPIDKWHIIWDFFWDKKFEMYNITLVYSNGTQIYKIVNINTKFICPNSVRFHGLLIIRHNTTIVTNLYKY